MSIWKYGYWCFYFLNIGCFGCRKNILDSTTTTTYFIFCSYFIKLPLFLNRCCFVFSLNNLSPKTGIKRQYHDVNDITRGEECVSIPIVCGEDGVLPPLFHYISQNITFQDAYINLSLARIGDENCCSGCFGDCLAEPLPCACARETGGEFAYTIDGLLKEGFLDACVSMLRQPLEQPYFYCEGVCPIEQMKKRVNSAKPDACKGHPIKKFIKECWRKCWCTRNCGNRVVQRGITRKLQASEVTYYRL
jgi:hypothetical protein